MNNIVSVLLPVYNGGNYLCESIESILNQTYRKFEFIIINDGSTDDSLEIIERYKLKDSRIIVISRENRGLIATLNEGIKKSEGRYIIRMDQDDISLPTRFEEQIKFMEENLDIGVCGSWVNVFGENRKSTIWKLPVSHDELKVRLLFSVPVAHPSVIIRKETIDTYKLKYKEEYKHTEDYKFWLDCSQYTRFANLPKVLLKYRYLDTSVSRIADSSQNDTRYNTIKSIFTQALDKLNIKNTEEENKLHFTIGLNERIAKEDIDLKVLNNYFNKIIEVNKKVKYFNEKYLMKFLSRKFLVVVYHQFKRRNYLTLTLFFNKYVYFGFFYILKDKVIEN